MASSALAGDSAHVPKGRFLLVSGPEAKLFTTIELTHTVVSNGKVTSTTEKVKVHLEKTLTIDGKGGLSEFKAGKEYKVPFNPNPVKGSYRELGSSRLEIIVGCEKRKVSFLYSDDKLTLIPPDGNIEVYERQK